MVRLKHKTDLAVSPLGQARRPHAEQRVAVGEHLPGAWLVESAEQMQQRALARAGHALNREEISAPDLEAHAVKHLHFAPAKVVRLVQLAR